MRDLNPGYQSMYVDMNMHLEWDAGMQRDVRCAARDGPPLIGHLTTHHYRTVIPRRSCLDS